MHFPFFASSHIASSHIASSHTMPTRSACTTCDLKRKRTGMDSDTLEADEMDGCGALTPPSRVRQERNELRRKCADLQAKEAERDKASAERKASEAEQVANLDSLSMNLMRTWLEDNKLEETQPKLGADLGADPLLNSVTPHDAY